MLLYVQMGVFQENVVASLESESPEVKKGLSGITEIAEEKVLEPEAGAQGTADISADTEFSHLVETEQRRCFCRKLAHYFGAEPLQN